MFLNGVANFSSCKVGCLPGNLSLVMAIFFLIFGVDCKHSIIFVKFSILFAFRFPWKHPLSVSRERTDLSVYPWKCFSHVVMPIWNTRKAVYKSIESGSRKKVGLDEVASTHVLCPDYRTSISSQVILPWSKSGDVAVSSKMVNGSFKRTCLWNFLAKHLIQLIRMYWFQNHGLFLN